MEATTIYWILTVVGSIILLAGLLLDGVFEGLDLDLADGLDGWLSATALGSLLAAGGATAIAFGPFAGLTAGLAAYLVVALLARWFDARSGTAADEVTSLVGATLTLTGATNARGTGGTAVAVLDGAPREFAVVGPVPMPVGTEVWVESVDTSGAVLHVQPVRPIES